MVEGAYQRANFGVTANVYRASHRWLIVGLVLAVTLLQRLAIQVAGLPVPFTLPMVFACLGLLWFLGAVRVDRDRAILLLLVWVLFIGSAFFSALRPPVYGAPSYAGLMFFMVLLAPFVLVAKGDTSRFYAHIVTAYLWVMLLAAVVGIAQFALQFIGIRLGDLLWSVVPEQFVMANFHYDIKLEFRSAYTKANGVFFLEPSFFSRALALAIILEFIYQRNVARLIAFHVALALSFSGTGLIVLAAGYPLLIRFIDARLLLIMTIVTLGTVVAFLASDFGAYTLNRVAEFSSQKSSAQARFVAPYVTILKLGLIENWGVGYGPGTGDVVARSLRSHTPFFLKSTFEYGLLPTLTLLWFMARCVLTSVAPLAVGIPLMIMYAILTGGLLATQTTYTLLVLAALTLGGAKSVESRGAALRIPGA